MSLLSLLRKQYGPSFEPTWNLLNQERFIIILKWAKVLEKKMKIWKDYRQTNDRQQAQKSPLDLSAQVSQKIFQGNDSYHVKKII